VSEANSGVEVGQSTSARLSARGRSTSVTRVTTAPETKPCRMRSPLASARDGLVASAVSEAVIASMHDDGRWTAVELPKLPAAAQSQEERR
jgi:hypothetical protein